MELRVSFPKELKDQIDIRFISDTDVEPKEVTPDVTDDGRDGSFKRPWKFDPNRSPKNTGPTGPTTGGWGPAGSQHPGNDSSSRGGTGGNYGGFTAGWYLNRGGVSGRLWFQNWDASEYMECPQGPNPDPNNSYPVPLLPAAK